MAGAPDLGNQLQGFLQSPAERTLVDFCASQQGRRQTIPVREQSLQQMFRIDPLVAALGGNFLRICERLLRFFG